MNNMMKRALTTAKISTVLEPSVACRSDGKRPDGMSLVPMKRGGRGVDTVALTYLEKISRNFGPAADLAENNKSIKYKDLAHVFFPIAVETYGVFRKQRLSFLKELG